MQRAWATSERITASVAGSEDPTDDLARSFSLSDLTRLKRPIDILRSASASFFVSLEAFFVEGYFPIRAIAVFDSKTSFLDVEASPSPFVARKRGSSGNEASK